MALSPEFAVRIWKPLYVHFTNKSYNIFTSNSKIHYGSNEIEEKGRQIIKFARKFNKDTDAGFFLIANYIEGNFNVPWNLDEESNDNYIKWIGRRESISYIVSNDVRLISDNCNKSDLYTKFPHESNLFKLYLNKKISPETLILVDRYYTPFLDKWGLESISNMMQDKVFRLIKYKPFVKHNEDKIKSIIGGELELS